MKLILDASVALKWVLPEADSVQALAVREAFQQGAHELLAPDVYPIECGHSLSKKQRQGLISDAMALWNDLMLDAPRLVASLPLLPAALQIAAEARMGVYDCLYVALAEREGCLLLTADERLVRSLPGRPIVLLSSLP
jgi:predicted nucleic acid-binding protein